MRPVRVRPLILLLSLALTGCSGIGVRLADAPGLFESLRISAVSETISLRTLQTLRNWDLSDYYHENPAETFGKLQAIAEQHGNPDVIFALAEIAYVLGRDTERCNCGNAIPWYYFCAGYSYHYLYGSGEKHCEPHGSPFDPRFRLACELYNTGLAKCIRAAQQVGKLDPRQALQLPGCDGKGFTLSVSHHGFCWKPEEFGKLILAQNYRTEGLANQHRTYGLGVPLIATRATPTPDPDQGLYPPGISFPVTAFFRFNGTLADLRAQRTGQLELHNPLSVHAIDVKGLRTPLETDLTTPLAYFLGSANLDKIGFQGFLRPDQLQSASGVYMLEPYQPGKIPVLFVHGLLSSPATWAPLVNELMADPVLRKRYQFWFYFYPTSNPYVMTAADLRDRLTALRQRLDPQRRDGAMDDMVLVGHSMGGLVSRLLTVDSGNDFWNLASAEPFEQLQASQATRDVLHRLFFFERQPSVKRVVFLGTPHHGSRLSPSLPGRVLRYFVHLPKNLVMAAQDISVADPTFMTHLKPETIPTSLDLLAPHAPALELLAARPKPPGVHYHSIIGVAPTTTYVMFERILSGASRTERGDGVVPYTSAHLADVDSELLVSAEHTEVHHHPFAVMEVRRILKAHLTERGIAVKPRCQPSDK